MFNGMESLWGKENFKCVHKSVTIALMDNIVRNYPLVPVKSNSSHRCIDLPKNEIELN